MSSLLWNVALALVWVVLTGRTGPGDFAVGFLVGSVVVYFVRRAGGVPRPFVKVYQSVDLLVFFLWQLVLANVKIAHDVVTPRHLMRPAIVAVPLDATSDVEIGFLSNLITLTPGTLAVDVSPDRSILYVHALYVRDRDELIAEIKQGFERRVLEVLQ
jgi:multicomponent Na+:H+ antiporter subunit E